MIAYVALSAVFMPWSGWVYLGDRLRERSLPVTRDAVEVRVALHAWAGARLRLLRLVDGVAPAIAAGHAVFVVVMLRGRASGWVGVAAVVAAILLARGIGRLLLIDETRVLERAVSQEAAFAVTAVGIRLPVCACSEPTRRLAHVRGLAELEVPWSEVVRIEVRDGPRGGHWLLEVSGAAVSLASSSPALYGLESPFISLLRVFPEQEAAALAIVKAKLGADRLVVRAALPVPA